MSADGLAGLAVELGALAAALALVLAAAFVFLRLLKRLNGAAAPSAELEFLRAMPVGPRERVVLMRWRGEALLLGVTAGAVTLLHRAPVSEEAPEQTRENPS